MEQAVGKKFDRDPRVVAKTSRDLHRRSVNRDRGSRRLSLQALVLKVHYWYQQLCCESPPRVVCHSILGVSFSFNQIGQRVSRSLVFMVFEHSLKCLNKPFPSTPIAIAVNHRP